MIAICPVGHSSLAQDYCDVCGLPIDSTTAPAATSTDAVNSQPGLQPCPNCGAGNFVDALFCESCGFAAASAETFDWVAEVWIDPAWYEAQQSPDPMPSPGLPAVVPLRSKSILIGRTSRSRNIHPQIDCEPDSGVSRRQTQLTTDGSRWWVEDLDSANGTFVAAATGPIPVDPIPVGVKQELAADDRVYVGAWTRIVIRRATEDEKASLA